MHLKTIEICCDRFPAGDVYPFNVPVFRQVQHIDLKRAVTFFIGENGTGKSTLLKALARKCGIQIWDGGGRTRCRHNPYEHQLGRYLRIGWTSGPVSGSFFASEIFQHFAEIVDEWARLDPGVTALFGGKSLVAQSHGQSLMSFFESRYRIRGLYLLDEPETALSPASQLKLLRLLHEAGRCGTAQFIIATHSPILLALPEAVILSFDRTPIAPVAYQDTAYYRIYKAFLENPQAFLPGAAPDHAG